MEPLYTLDTLMKLPSNPAYGAFYSSVLGGFTTDSRLMVIPMDDHLVHRGDGVFEAIKIAHGKPYLITPHMERMFRSADKIGLPLYHGREKMIELIHQTWRHASQKLGTTGVVRAFLSRGPGNFGVSPSDTVGSQFYVVATSLAPVSLEKLANGVKIGRASRPTKPSWLAQAKTCNYLPNVLQKRDAELKGVEYAIALDPNGKIAESATENVVIINKHGELVRPKTDYILEGCTMNRVFELAKVLLDAEDSRIQIKNIRVADITEEDLLQSREVLMMGSTFDILPVTSYEGHAIGDGKPGPVGQKLRELVLRDQL